LLGRGQTLVFGGEVFLFDQLGVDGGSGHGWFSGLLQNSVAISFIRFRVMIGMCRGGSLVSVSAAAVDLVAGFGFEQLQRSRVFIGMLSP
jgi:hypothetical protein